MTPAFCWTATSRTRKPWPRAPTSCWPRRRPGIRKSERSSGRGWLRRSGRRIWGCGRSGSSARFFIASRRGAGGSAPAVGASRDPFPHFLPGRHAPGAHDPAVDDHGGRGHDDEQHHFLRLTPHQNVVREKLNFFEQQGAKEKLDEAVLNIPRGQFFLCNAAVREKAALQQALS